MDLQHTPKGLYITQRNRTGRVIESENRINGTKYTNTYNNVNRMDILNSEPIHVII